MTQWKRLSICITPEEHKKLRLWAASHGVSVSTLVREVLMIEYEAAVRSLTAVDVDLENFLSKRDKAARDLDVVDADVTSFLKGLDAQASSDA